MQFFKVSGPQKHRVPPPPFRTDLGGGYPPLLGKNYTPLENLQISVKIEKWARFGMAAHLWSTHVFFLILNFCRFKQLFWLP